MSNPLTVRRVYSYDDGKHRCMMDLSHYDSHAKAKSDAAETILGTWKTIYVDKNDADTCVSDGRHKQDYITFVSMMIPLPLAMFCFYCVAACDPEVQDALKRAVIKKSSNSTKAVGFGTQS